MAQNPVDIVLLDVNMPEMDGLETLGHIRQKYPQTAVVRGAIKLLEDDTLLQRVRVTGGLK